MDLLPECLDALKYRAFWESVNTPCLRKFLEFRFRTGDLEDSTAEHFRYKKDLDTISSYHVETSEVGQMVEKWQREFRNDRNSRSIKLFWRLQDVVTESKLVDEKLQLQWKEGMLEFEEIGLRYLQETSSAVQEKQIRNYTSYKRSALEVDGEEEIVPITLTKKRKGSSDLSPESTLSIDGGSKTATSSPFDQMTDNIDAVMNDKNSTRKIHNEPEISNDYNEELENDEEIKFDLANITKELQKEPTVVWKVGSINVTQRFRQYQIEVLKKADKEGLTYENIYEILALSSIIVLCSPCPYPIFTKREWREILETNPYIIQEPPLPPEISLSLREASFNHFLNKDVFIEGGKSRLNRAVARSFNDLYNNVSKVASPKISENEHCYKFLYPIICPFFSDENEYELLLNRANAGSKKRPDFSCTVDAVPILNSEFKPLGCTPLQRKKDRLKVQLKAQKSINQQLERKGGPGEAGILLNMGDLMESFFMDLKYDGLYRSWSFFTTKLVIDQTTIPLAEASITHMVALEKHVGQIAENFKYRSNQFTPSAQT